MPPLSSTGSVNPALLGLLGEKTAFVPGGDPAMMGAAGGDPAAGGAPPPGGDPMAGGAPPPGGDPMAAGGAPPAGGDPMAAMQPMIQQAVQQAMAAQGGGAAGGGGGGEGGIKPKIDVNVELMQIKKMLARALDALGVQMPMAEMVATEGDLTQMARGADPAAQAAAPAPGGESAIQPIQPMQGAAPADPAAGGEPKQASDTDVVSNGVAFNSPALDLNAGGSSLGNQAAMAVSILRSRGQLA